MECISRACSREHRKFPCNFPYNFIFFTVILVDFLLLVNDTEYQFLFIDRFKVADIISVCFFVGYIKLQMSNIKTEEIEIKKE